MAEPAEPRRAAAPTAPSAARVTPDAPWVVVASPHDPRLSSGAGLVLQGRLAALRRLGCRIHLVHEGKGDAAALGEHTNAVTVVAPGGVSARGVWLKTRRLLRSGYAPKWSSRTWQALCAAVDTHRPAVVLLDDLRLAEHGRLLRRRGFAGGILLHEHNVEHRLLARQRLFTRRAGKRLELRFRIRRFRAQESSLARYCDTCLALSPDDQALLAELNPGLDVCWLAPQVDLEHYARLPEDATAPELLFVGSMNWAANRDGITWFVRRVWPSIRAAVPEAHLTIVGRNPPDWLQQLGAAVEAPGFVPDERPYTQRARVMIVPLRFGSGVRIKILNAFAMGRAVVSTRLGAEGIGAKGGEDLLLADEPDDFAAAVVQLLRQPDEAQRIAAAGHRLCLAHYAPARVDAALAAVLQRYLPLRSVRM